MPSAIDALLLAAGGTVAGAVAPSNAAPTGVALTNAVTGINENTPTASRIKVADIVVVDDALGTNTLGLTGADATFFEIDGTSLYLKAGAVLDYETKTSYAVVVTADDTSVGATPDASGAYALTVGNTIDTAIEVALVAIGGVIGGALTPTNAAPTAVVLTNAVAAIDEDAATASRIKVADIAVIDDALGTSTLGLTGADAGFFEIDGTSLYLKAGTVLDFGTKASYAVAVTADDTSLGGTPDATSVTYTLAVNQAPGSSTSINRAPTAVVLTNTVTSLDETCGAVVGSPNVPTTSDIKVADIAVIDDGLGTNVLGLAGADAAFFKIVGTSLYVKAGTVLDFETRASYAVAVTVDDASVGTTPDATSATHTLVVVDVDETPALPDPAPLPIPQAPTFTGTSGDDTFTAPAGSGFIDGLGGVDTVIFDFALTDATVTYLGNKIIVDGPSSHTVLTGLEVFRFTDGTVDNADGNPLVDDLFYFSRNHDVWKAHVDADAHYDTFGWHENRDPNAFFSTSTYLSANADVKAAGINPLEHWHAFGWSEGRVPSIHFDPRQYLEAEPDVKAAHIDPLAHFLQSGAQDGAQPFGTTELIAAGGFDYVYYLQNNPDVAAANVDPLQHFQDYGWREGRNPNALFDTRGYLAAYADVASANINPLDHYNAFGWHEGRDPSGGFDTTSYLAAYPDVQAAGVNPLLHYLSFGLHESRSPFADGVWG